MTDDVAAVGAHRVGFWPNAAAVLALTPMTFVIVVVNYWIYRARIDFIALHPAFSAEQPPTISRAISDPVIGEPFAFWVTISALLLAIGVLPIGWLYDRSARALPPGCTRNFVHLSIRLAVASQFVACVGMVILSNWRSPDHGDGHMVGSYIFFIAQAVTVLVVGLMCRAILRDEEAVRHLNRPGLINPRMSRFRVPLCFLGVGLSLLFLVLFVAKGFDFEYGYDAMYQLYVLSEPALISCFLLVFTTFYPELVLAIRGKVRAVSRPLP